MFQRIRSYFAVAVLAIATGLSVPSEAFASGYDYEVTASASASNVSVPSVIAWEVSAASVGDAMGLDGYQSIAVSFEVPTSISLIVPPSNCSLSGRVVTCSDLVTDSYSPSWTVQGTVALTAIGTITVTPTITVSDFNTDANPNNDSDPVSCTAVTSILVTC